MIFLLILLVLAAIGTVTTTRLMKSVIGLALTSVTLSMILFSLSAPIAGAFELSVCAGLIPVIFITAVSFTERMTAERFKLQKAERLSRFRALPILVLALGILLWNLPAGWQLQVATRPPIAEETRQVLWGFRRLDLIGQVLVLLAGAWGVNVFFKDKKS